MRRLAPALLAAAPLAALALTACARSEEAFQVPTDNGQGYNMIGRVQLGNEDDGEPSVGEWRQALQEERQTLRIRAAGHRSLVQPGLRRRARRHRPAAPRRPARRAAAADAGDDREASEELDVQAGGGTIPLLRATVAGTSPVGQALATTPQPIQVRLADGTPLVLPGSIMVGDYVRGCARPGGPAGNSMGPAPGRGTLPLPAPAPVANTATPRAELVRILEDPASPAGTHRISRKKIQNKA